jgi:predicted nucleotidyltransferase
MIEAMMLFGSSARSDSSDSSDVDLLAIHNASEPYNLKKTSLELQFLTRKLLLELAENGDLFAIHLAFEGKVIFDKTGVFNEFRESLKIKKSYLETVKKASSLGWFLIEHGNLSSNRIMLRKRITWCLRSILIAKLVESGRIIFSPSGLIEAFQDDNVTYLIKNRRSKKVGDSTFKKFTNIIRKYGDTSTKNLSLSKYVELFEETKNNVAIQTYNKLFSNAQESIDSDDFYL